MTSSIWERIVILSKTQGFMTCLRPLIANYEAQEVLQETEQSNFRSLLTMEWGYIHPSYVESIQVVHKNRFLYEHQQETLYLYLKKRKDLEPIFLVLIISRVRLFCHRGAHATRHDNPMCERCGTGNEHCFHSTGLAILGANTLMLDVAIFFEGTINLWGI